VCEHRGIRRSRFHHLRAERRRSIDDQSDIIPNPSAAASQDVGPYRKLHCYAASWGFACSTNRKNRVLHVRDFEPNSGQFKRAMITHKWRLLVNYADVA